MKLKEKSGDNFNFQVRESLLTELFEKNVHIRTVRNFLIAALLNVFIYTVATDYFGNGETQFGFSLIKHNFGKIHIAVSSWIIFIAISFLCFLSFTAWANVRISLFPNSASIKLMDFMCLFLLGGYYIFTFYVPMYLVRKLDLPLASATIVLAEQLRIAMKVHAFVRSNSPKVLNYKSHEDDPMKLPTFWHFLYFMFAPTLIYRDEYSRTKTIRWMFVGSRLLEVPAAIICLSIIFDQCVLPPYRSFGTRPFTWGEICIAVINNMVPAMAGALLIFYMILHSVQNFFAELLRFGDRTFYSDWWTSTEYSVYYRKWNIIVHEWLYIFVYREVQTLTRGNKVLATTVVFLISTLAHEWSFCNMVGGFIPVITVEYFVFGQLLYYIKMPKNSFFNVLFLYTLWIGASILLGLYSLEYYARLNAPAKYTSFWSYVWPRCFTCDCIQG